MFTPAELWAIADEAEDVADGHPGTHYVSLLKKEPTAALAREIEALSTDRDVARVRGRAVHLVITDPYHHAKLSNATLLQCCAPDFHAERRAAARDAVLVVTDVDVPRAGLP